MKAMTKIQEAAQASAQRAVVCFLGASWVLVALVLSIDEAGVASAVRVGLGEGAESVSVVGEGVAPRLAVSGGVSLGVPRSRGPGPGSEDGGGPRAQALPASGRYGLVVGGKARFTDRLVLHCVGHDVVGPRMAVPPA